jgi:hypothetical protein
MLLGMKSHFFPFITRTCSYKLARNSMSSVMICLIAAGPSHFNGNLSFECFHS